MAIETNPLTAPSPIQPVAPVPLGMPLPKVNTPQPISPFTQPEQVKKADAAAGVKFAWSPQQYQQSANITTSRTQEESKRVYRVGQNQLTEATKMETERTKQQIKAEEEVISGLRTEISSLNGRVSSLNSEISSVQGQVNSLRARTDSAGQAAIQATSSVASAPVSSFEDVRNTAFAAEKKRMDGYMSSSLTEADKLAQANKIADEAVRTAQMNAQRAQPTNEAQQARDYQTELSRQIVMATSEESQTRGTPAHGAAAQELDRLRGALTASRASYGNAMGSSGATPTSLGRAIDLPRVQQMEQEVNVVLANAGQNREDPTYRAAQQNFMNYVASLRAQGYT